MPYTTFVACQLLCTTRHECVRIVCSCNYVLLCDAKGIPEWSWGWRWGCPDALMSWEAEFGVCSVPGCRSDAVMVRWAATFAECFVACLPRCSTRSFAAEACLMLYVCQLSALCSRSCPYCSSSCFCYYSAFSKVLCFCSMKRKNSNKQRKLIFRQCRIIPTQRRRKETKGRRKGTSIRSQRLFVVMRYFRFVVAAHLRFMPLTFCAQTGNNSQIHLIDFSCSLQANSISIRKFNGHF